MDHLKDIKRVEQVYSNDLNEVLLKTPPTLFKYALIAFAACLLIVALLSFTIEYEKTQQFDYVLYESEHVDHIELLFFSKQPMKEKIKSNTIVIETSNSVLPGSAQKIEFLADTIIENKAFEIAGSPIDIDKSSVNQLDNVSNINASYKYTLISNHPTLKENLDAFKVGKLNVSLGKAKLYEMFF